MNWIRKKLAIAEIFLEYTQKLISTDIDRGKFSSRYYSLFSYCRLHAFLTPNQGKKLHEPDKTPRRVRALRPRGNVR